MSELFTIFEDNVKCQPTGNVRHQVNNIENMGKRVSTSPTKLKEAGPKKSFLYKYNTDNTLSTGPIKQKDAGPKKSFLYKYYTGNTLMTSPIKQKDAGPKKSFLYKYNTDNTLSTGPIKQKEAGPKKSFLYKYYTGNTLSSGPIKQKGVEPKKSFLCNTGKALQGTSESRQAATINIGELIYKDADPKADATDFEAIELTRPVTPVYRNDNYHKDLLDYLPLPEPEFKLSQSPPGTPEPDIPPSRLECDRSCHDDFFTDNIPNGSFHEQDDSKLDLPALY